MIRRLRGGPARRYLAGASVSLLGGGLLAVPLYDIWDDATNLSWDPSTTLVENALFLVLVSVLLAGGMWLVRSEWSTDEVETIARRTVLATAVIALLVGWAVSLQLLAMGSIKPYVVAMDGVIVGAVASFGFSVFSVRAGTHERRAKSERDTRNQMESLYRTTSDLESVTTPGEAYDEVEAAVRDALPGTSFRVVVDGDVVVDEVGAAPPSPDETVPVGDRGRIELWGGPFDRKDLITVELFGSYLDDALGRIEREERLREERDVLEFVNRTLRHDLTGDIALLQARLDMVDPDAPEDDEHLQVSLERLEHMESFVGTMRTYMGSVLREDHDLEPTPLRPVLSERVATLREDRPEATVVCEDIPGVEVQADDLLDRAFANLLDNAVEHSDRLDPEVVVEAEVVDDAVRVRVSDDGPGISAERREAIFEKGVRGADSEGTGFGLHLVRDVVESYGGTIRVRDNEPRGTVFEVDLPLSGGGSGGGTEMG